MCLGIPGKVVEFFPEEPGTTRSELSLRRGLVDFGGVRKEVCFSCIDDVALGDYVIVHVGFAISKIDEKEAAEVFRLIQEMEDAGAIPPGILPGAPAADRPSPAVAPEAGGP